MENELASQAAQTHVFSPHFFTALEKCTQEMSAGELGRWTKNINLFSKDFIVVPIIEPAHWYLGIICYPGGEFADEGAGEQNTKK